MAQYTYTRKVADFELYSSYQCGQIDGVWQIVDGPHAASADVKFPIELPSDADVVSITFTADLSGHIGSRAQYIRMDGLDFSDGTVSIPSSYITANMTEYTAVFSYLSTGSVQESTSTYAMYVTFSNPTVTIVYNSDIGGGGGDDGGDEDEPSVPVTPSAPASSGRLPRLLDANLNEVNRLHPVKLSLNLKLTPLSTASMQLPEGEPEIKVQDFLELYDTDGSVGIFRVSETEMTYGSKGGQRVYMEHAFSTMADTLAVGVQAMSGTFREVVQALLDAQHTPYWTLGDVELPDEYEVVYTYRYDSIYTSIMELLDMLPEGYALVLDTSTRPFVMHLRSLNDEDFCEFRMNRNLSSAKVTIDRSQLCTRVYPFGSGEGTDRINLETLTGREYMDAETVDTWGIVAKTFTNENIFDSIALQDVAQRYLDRHKNPTVSVTLDALSLYAATGEPLDRFWLGRMCRLPLPAYGVQMNERVVGISRPDVYGQPEKANITLANQIRSLSDEIGTLMREATASKLIGGTVSTTEDKNSAGDITSTEPLVHYFDITSYGNLLAARVSYTASPSVKCRVRVDGTTIEGSENMGNIVDIMRYLRTDDNGVPTLGEHYVQLSPTTANYNYYWIYSTVTLKTIERA